MDFRRIVINSSRIDDTTADIAKKANESIIQELKKRIGDDIDNKDSIIGIFKHEIEVELKKINAEIELFRKLKKEKQTLLLKKEHWLKELDARVEIFNNGENFKFSKNNIAFFIFAILLSIVFSILASLPLLLTFSLVVVGGTFELSRHEIEKKINKHFQVKHFSKIEDDLKNIVKVKYEIEKLKNSINANEIIIEHDLNIKLYLTEAICIIDKELNKTIEEVEEKAKTYLKS